MKILFTLLLLLSFSVSAFANIYIVVDSATTEIISISPEDDCVLTEGTWYKEVIPGDYRNLELGHKACFYKYSGGNFILNVDKIAEFEAEQEEIAEIGVERREVEKKLMKMGIKELEDEGKTFKHKDKLEE